MTPFTILAPGLDTSQTKLLKVIVNAVRLPWTAPSQTLADASADCRHVLSVGRDALNLWHDFGLIRIGANHGDVFTHHPPPPAVGPARVVMVVEHPGTLQQLSFVGHQARDDMVADLRRWRMVLAGELSVDACSAQWCGGCLKMREPRHRDATYWVEELDGVGLCDGHWRKRAQYRRRVARVAKKDAGKMEHQIPGQAEWFPGDGTRLIVSKS